MANLKRTLNNLKKMQPLSSKAVAVLFTPALNKKRFLSERKKQNFFTEKFYGKKEFVQLQTRFDESWKTYYSRVVLPLLPYLSSLVKHNSERIISDATFNDFKTQFDDADIKCIIVVAHHIVENNAVEFADGGVPLEKLKTFLHKNKNKDEVAVIFMVCDLDDAIRETGGFDGFNSLGWASWKMPLIESVIFVHELLGNLNGNVTLMEAYDNTVKKLLSDE